MTQVRPCLNKIVSHWTTFIVGLNILTTIQIIINVAVHTMMMCTYYFICAVFMCPIRVLGFQC
jgi:hypothetical protein